jgi:hypothetical protein
MGLMALLPLQWKAHCRVLSPLAGFEPANFGSSAKYANHYTMEDDSMRIILYPIDYIHWIAGCRRDDFLISVQLFGYFPTVLSVTS